MQLATYYFYKLTNNKKYVIINLFKIVKGIYICAWWKTNYLEQ